MLLLGIDIGTSSIKVSVVDSQTQQCVAWAQYPSVENEIISLQAGWAEQDPAMWWQCVQQAITSLSTNGNVSLKDVAAIGIAYQMHGLVVVDKNKEVLRNSIIWCDSRAVPFGNAAFDAIGHDKSLQHLLNSPGNFTAAKLAWVKNNEPALFQKIDQLMLPGDYIAMQLTGQITTSASALSEGIFWDFTEEKLSGEVMEYFGFETSLIPPIQQVFSNHGEVLMGVAEQLGLTAGIPVTYKAGDQPNNALSLNVLNPGEVAATAGTSGVIYGVSDQLAYDPQSRINTFAHVNHSATNRRLGVLLCINGTGILNRWVKDTAGAGHTYQQLNNEAAQVDIGSNGLRVLPFGNGAERMLGNQLVGATFGGLDVNVHKRAHLVRASQEGIAFAFKYGLDIMRQNGIHPTVIRAGKANMFLSEVFTSAFVNSLNVPVEMFTCDGSVGAAIGAGIGSGIYSTAAEAFSAVKPLSLITPTKVNEYNDHYQRWKLLLESQVVL